MWNLYLYKNDEHVTNCSCSNHAEGMNVVEALSKEYDRIEVHTGSYYLFTYRKVEKGIVTQEIPAYSYCVPVNESEDKIHSYTYCNRVFNGPEDKIVLP